MLKRKEILKELKSIENVDREAMWPGSERSLNVNVRCDQGYGEAIDRAQLDLVHAEIARPFELGP